MIYKLLKLKALDQESRKLELMHQELKSENSKLDDRIANLTAEENQAIRQANIARLHEEKIRDQVRVQRKAEEDDLEYFRSESAQEVEETNKEYAALVSEVAALKAQKKLFGG
jgi:exonuclease VII large subunit